MGKVMYIEDSPETGFIINVFGKLLSSQEKQDLRESENDPTEVQKALKNNLVLEVVTDFSLALKRLDKNLNEYDLLIVDRDLYDNGLKYQPDNLIATQPAFNESYHKREGDFLIGYCKMKGYDIDNRFFIFTGNTDDLVQSPELKLLLSDKFKSENVIVKGSEGKDRLIQIIAALKDLKIKLRNKEVFEVFRKGYLDNKYQQEIINALTNDNLNYHTLREMFEESLKQVAATLKANGIEKDFTKKGGNLNPKSLFEYLNGSVSFKTDFKPVSKEYFSQTHYNLSDCLWGSISEILHGGGNEYREYKYENSKYTPKIMLYTLMDFLLWYGDFMDKYKLN